MLNFRRLAGGATNMLDPRRRNLTYLMPGLSELEFNYVKSQTQLLLDLDLKSFSNDHPSMKEITQAHAGNKKLLLIRLNALMDLCEIKDKMRSLLQNEFINTNKVDRHSPYFPQIDRHCPYFLQKFSRRLLFWAHNSRDLNELLPLMSKNKQKYVTAPRNRNCLRTLIYDDDRLNQLRNSYINNKLLHSQNEVATLPLPSHRKKVNSLEGHLHSLEALIQLNVVDRLLFETMHREVKRRLILRRGFLENILSIPSLSGYLSIPLYYKVLQQLQFSNQQISQTLCFTPRRHLEKLCLVLRHTDDWDLEVFVQELTKRKQAVESLKKRLPSNEFTHYELIACLANFNDLMTKANKSQEGLRIVTYPEFDTRTKCDNTSKVSFIMYPNMIHWLEHRIGQRVGVMRIIKTHLFIRLAEKDNMLGNLAYLEAEGFTSSQIGNGAEVLLYQHNKLVEAISKLDSSDPDKSWRNCSKALALVGYHIEAARDFTVYKRKKNQLQHPIRLARRLAVLKEREKVAKVKRAEKEAKIAEKQLKEKRRWEELVNYPSNTVMINSRVMQHRLTTPTTAYEIWCASEHRQQIDPPNRQPTDQQLTHKWQQLSETDKLPFIAEANRLLEQHAYLKSWRRQVRLPKNSHPPPS